MKRLAYILMTLALLAGCTKAETGRGEENTSTVHFSVGTLQTFVGEGVKSIGDGSTATELLVGVFDADGKAIEGYGKAVSRSAGEAFDFELALVNNITYKVVLFAQRPDRYVKTASWTAEGLKNISLNFGALNADADDAFAAVKEITVTGSGNVTVSLSRIFAQVNVASSTDPGAVSVSLKLTGIPTAYNAYEGSFAGSADITWSADAPLGVASPFDGYDYIGYAYVPACASGFTNATITIGDAGDKVKTVNSVPLRANYRTNILGEI